MDIVIATSRAFHLAHLSRELATLGHNVTLIGYVPTWRMSRYSYAPAVYKSEFLSLLPDSALALQRPFPGAQRRATLQIMADLDLRVIRSLPKCDVFIGLSGVIVDAFKRAREEFGAVTICERASAHIRVQERLLTRTDGKSGLDPEYVDRELASYINAEYVSVPSDFAYQSFIDEGFPDRRLFSNVYGVNLSRFQMRPRPAGQSSPFKVLYVGGWSYQKGCDLLADALSENGDWQLTHAGLRDDLPFPVNDRFTTLGHVPNSQLPEVYASHDAFILPSRQDGFGMVLLESLASGLPILASAFTGAADVLKHLQTRDRVRIIDDLSAAGICREIERLVADCGSGRMSAHDPSDLEAFTWQAYGARYARFLDQVT